LLDLRHTRHPSDISRRDLLRSPWARWASRENESSKPWTLAASRSLNLRCAPPSKERTSLFTGWRAFSEQVLKILLDKFRDFGYVKLREFEHGVAEELPSSWPHRKIKAEDRLPSAAVAQYSRRE